MDARITFQSRLNLARYFRNLEPTALAQARNLANLPFAFRHVAVMPDAHCGYGMPIGGVRLREL